MKILYAASVHAHVPEVAHGLCVALVRGEAEPPGRLPAVLQDPLAFEEQIAHGDLRVGIAVLGSL